MSAPSSTTGICGIGTDITGSNVVVDLNLLPVLEDPNRTFLMIRHLREASIRIHPDATENGTAFDPSLTHSALESTLQLMLTELDLLPMARGMSGEMMGGVWNPVDMLGENIKNKDSTFFNTYYDNIKDKIATNSLYTSITDLSTRTDINTIKPDTLKDIYSYIIKLYNGLKTINTDTNTYNDIELNTIIGDLPAQSGRPYFNLGLYILIQAIIGKFNSKITYLKNYENNEKNIVDLQTIITDIKNFIDVCMGEFKLRIKGGSRDTDGTPLLNQTFENVKTINEIRRFFDNFIKLNFDSSDKTKLQAPSERLTEILSKIKESPPNTTGKLAPTPSVPAAPADTATTSAEPSTLPSDAPVTPAASPEPVVPAAPGTPSSAAPEKKPPSINNCYRHNVQTLLLALAYIKYLKMPPPMGTAEPIKVFLQNIRDYLNPKDGDEGTVRDKRRLYLSIQVFLTSLQLTPASASASATSPRGVLGDDGVTPMSAATDAVGDALQVLNPSRYALLQAILDNPVAHKKFISTMSQEESTNAATMQRLRDFERALKILKNQPNYSPIADPSGETYAKLIQNLIQLSGFPGFTVEAIPKSGGAVADADIKEAYDADPKPFLERPPSDSTTPILNALSDKAAIAPASPHTPIQEAIRDHRNPPSAAPAEPSSPSANYDITLQQASAATQPAPGELTLPLPPTAVPTKQSIIQEILDILTKKITLEEPETSKILSFVASFSDAFPEGFDTRDDDGFENRVYGVIVTNIKDKKIVGIPESDLKTKLNSALEASSLNQTNFLAIIDAYQPLMDSVNKVRILLNYRTNFGNKEAKEQADTETANTNFKKLYTYENGNTGKTFVPIQNLVDISSVSGGNIGVGTTIQPFYQVLNSDSIKNYLVEKDLALLDSDTPHHLLYSAYGFSGSGKTYSMFDEKAGLLGRLIGGLTEQQKNTLQYRIYDYYGELPDPAPVTGQTCAEPRRKNPRTTYYNQKDYKSGTLEQLSNDINAFNELRKKDWSLFGEGDLTLKDTNLSGDNSLASYAFKEPFGATEFHIRATPNNPDSSRSHLFVDIKIGTHRITLMDMAGAENVDAIQQMYFVEIPRLDVGQFNTQINNLITKLIPYQGQTSQAIQTFLYPSKGTQHQLSTITTLTRINGETDELIKSDAWGKILGNNDFVQFYNLYKYMILIEPIYKLNYILNVLCDKVLPPSSSSIGENVTLKKLNNLFAILKLPAIRNTRITGNKKDITTTFFEFLESLIPLMEQYMKDILIKYIEVIPSSIDIGNEFDKYFKFKVTGQSINNTNQEAFNTIKDKTKKWKINYIQNIHCPLRFQGNFIMDTLEKMKGTVQGLTKNPPESPNTKFPYDILYAGDPPSSPPTQKVMLFVNTRLDFNPDATDEANERMKGAYRNALTFAIQMNPLIPDSNPIKTAATAYEATGGAEPEGASYAEPESAKVTPTSIRYAPKFIEGIINMKGGAPNDTPMGTPTGTATTPLTAPANIAATPTLVPGANPSAAMANAKENTKKLNALTKSLIEVKNNLDGLEGSISRFETFKKSVMVEKDDGAGKKTWEKKPLKDESDKNDAVGAYNYLNEEGKTLNTNFAEKVKTLITSLETVQKDLVAILEAEAPTPITRNNLLDITKIFEQKIEGLSGDSDKNTGLINSLKTLQQSFASEYETAFGYAKQLAVPIIDQRKLEAERLKANPAMAAELRIVQDIYGTGVRDLDEFKIQNSYDTIIASKLDTDTVKKDITEFKKLFAPLEDAVQAISSQTSRVNAEDARDRFRALLDKTKTSIETLSKSILQQIEQAATKGGRRRQHGGEALQTKVLIEVVKQGIQKIQDIVKRLTTVYTRQGTPGFALSTTDNLFSRILNEYLNTRTDETEMQSRNRFMEQLETNNLIPRKVLAISTMDRVIFVFLTLFLRTFATSVMVYLIERGTITSMKIAIAGYMILYALTLMAFVMLVNLDMYRMRIIFNYVNFHANASKVYMHLGLLVVIGILIYIVITKINFPVRSVSPKAISDNQKVRLIMRFQILTGILWGILALIVALESV